MRPFRFGVQLSHGTSAAEWRATAQRLEDLGYSTLFLPDHFTDQWAPLVALTAAAGATTTLRVGSLVFDNDYRHPVELAREIATLDLVTDGRVEFGLGAGWMRSDYDEAGIPYDPPGVRIDRMGEGLRIMKDLWSTGTSTRSGAHYHVSGARGVPRPHGAQGPPVIIGGGGRRILGMAAREADIVGFNPILTEGFMGPRAAASSSAAHYRERVDWVRAAAGDRFADLELQVTCFVVEVGEGREEFFARTAPLFDMSPGEAAEVPVALVGTVGQICETLQQRREDYGFSYWVVHGQDVEVFAPVVAALAGR